MQKCSFISIGENIEKVCSGQKEIKLFALGSCEEQKRAVLLKGSRPKKLKFLADMSANISAKGVRAKPLSAKKM